MTDAAGRDTPPQAHPAAQSPHASRLAGLGFRLMGVFAVALLPLGILSYVQSERFADEAAARSEQALIGLTLRAATPVTDTLRRAEGVAAAAAESVPMLADRNACGAYMARLVAAEPTLSFAGYIPVNGLMTCASNGRVHDFSDSPGLADLRENPRPVITLNPNGPISGEAVVIFSHPVRDAAGAVVGFVSVSAPHRRLDRLPGMDEAPLALATFGADGRVLTAMLGLETIDQRLPVGYDLAELARQAPVVLTAPIANGTRKSFAVAPIIDGRLYVLSSWPAERRVIETFGLPLPLWLFPVAMLLASLAVAWLAAEHQVLRPIRALSAAMVAFAQGRRTVSPPALTTAPAELRNAGEAFETMVDSVLHDEAEIADALHQKEVLLREVHHRVKNNLQLIASIMNIQMRKALSPEAKVMVKGLHDRVLSLATVHRELYQTSGLADVRADEMLGKIVALVMRMGAAPGTAPVVDMQLEGLRLTPDQAVPLSLILTEALTNVLKHARPDADGRPARLRVQLTRTDAGRARLSVANTMTDDGQGARLPPDVDSTGMGGQLLAAFAMQLGGTLEVGPGAEGFMVAVDFPIRALSEAEARFAAA